MSDEKLEDRSWGAVVVTVKREGVRYLLVRHANGGHWDHPKGHPEDGEIPEETAVREVREETGWRIALIPGFLSEVSYQLPSGHPKSVGFFLGRAEAPGDTGGPEGEILDSVWLSYPLARARITYETGKKVLEEADAFLAKLAARI